MSSDSPDESGSDDSVPSTADPNESSESDSDEFDEDSHHVAGLAASMWSALQKQRQGSAVDEGIFKLPGL